MNILITGGAGFIGSNLSDALLSTGNNIIILDNFDPFYAVATKRKNISNILTNPNAKLVEGDIRDKKILDDIFSQNNIDVVIHLAAKAGVRPSIESIEEYYDVNVTGTLNILECMKKHSVTKMAFASSSSVYGNSPTVPFNESDFVDHPISPYAATKKSGELLCHVYCHLYGFDISCLRFFTVYGPRQRPDLAINKFTRLILNGSPIPFFGDGTSARDYTFVNDIVDGIIKSLPNLKGYNVYNLGESSTITLSQMVQTLSNIIGKEAIIDKKPKQPGDVELTYANVSKAKSEIGYNPRVDVESGLRQFVDWFKESQDEA